MAVCYGDGRLEGYLGFWQRRSLWSKIDLIRSCPMARQLGSESHPHNFRLSLSATALAQLLLLPSGMIGHFVGRPDYFQNFSNVIHTHVAGTLLAS